MEAAEPGRPGLGKLREGTPRRDLRVTPLRAAAYVVAQCGGAIAGSSVVLGLYGGAEHGDLQYTATRWC